MVSGRKKFGGEGVCGNEQSDMFHTEKVIKQVQSTTASCIKEKNKSNPSDK